MPDNRLCAVGRKLVHAYGVENASLIAMRVIELLSHGPRYNVHHLPTTVRKLETVAQRIALTRHNAHAIAFRILAVQDCSAKTLAHRMKQFRA